MHTINQKIKSLRKTLRSKRLRLKRKRVLPGMIDPQVFSVHNVNMPALRNWLNRVDEALPPSRDAGTEIEAVFAAERLSRDPGLRERLKHGKLKLTGPVILLDGHVVGSNQLTTCKATLSGQAIPVEHYLEPLERDLLNCMDTGVDISTLLAIAHKTNVDEETLYGALRSLLRKGLVRLANS